jgi:hypothetical protein
VVFIELRLGADERIMRLDIVDDQSLIWVCVGCFPSVLVHRLGQNGLMFIVPSITLPNVDYIVKFGQEVFSVPIELWICGHIDGIFKLSTDKIPTKEFDGCRPSRYSGLQPSGQFVIRLKHIVATGVEDEEIVPVFVEDVNPVRVEFTFIEPSVIEAIRSPSEQVRVLECPQ